MCRTGGRRCPGGHSSSREAAARRQRLSRARRGLATAQASGDVDAIARAMKKLAMAGSTTPAAEAQPQAVTAGGGDVTPTSTSTTAAAASGAASQGAPPAGDVPEAPVAATRKRRTAAGKRPARPAPAGAAAGGAAVPEPRVAEPAAPAPVSGELLNQPLIENGWGGLPTSPVHFHEDGEIGTAIQFMGRDRFMDVDGEPLGDVLGKVATDVVRGRRSAQDGVDAYKEIRDRLPEGSQARWQLTNAIDKIDAPPAPAPAVPDTTPEPLRQLVADLNAVPLARREPDKELNKVVAMCENFATDQTSGRIKARLAADELRRLPGARHESQGDAGKFEIDRAIDKAREALASAPPDAFDPPKRARGTKAASATKPVDKPAAAGRPDNGPADVPAIASRLRETATEEEGAAYLRGQHLDRESLLAVAGELQLTRVGRLSQAELEKRVLKQAIGARRKFAGLRQWNDRTKAAEEAAAPMAKKPARQPKQKRATRADTSAAWKDHDRVRQAFTELVGRPGGWVSLTRLRKHLGNPPKEEFDAVLRELAVKPNVYLNPEFNQKTLTPEDRAAAVRSGGEDLHLIRFE